MEAATYQRLAMTTQANQEAIRERVYALGSRATQIDNATRGLTDEVGEINSAVKKWLEYGQPLDQVNLVEEVGDCMWRLAQLMDAIDMSLSDAMTANLSKLKVRYDGIYTDEQAEEGRRNREKEREEVEKFLEQETGKFDDPHANWKHAGCP